MKSFSPAGAATKAYYGLGARTFGNPDGNLSGNGASAAAGGSLQSFARVATFPGDAITDVAILNATHAAVVTRGANAGFTTDGAQTWTPVAGPLGLISQTADQVIANSAGSSLVAHGLDGGSVFQLAHSGDGGQTWTNATPGGATVGEAVFYASGPDLFFFFDFVTANVWVSAGGSVWVSHAIPSGIGVNNAVQNDLNFDQAEGAGLVVVTAQSNGGWEIWTSPDAITWTLAFSLAPIATTFSLGNVAFDGSNFVACFTPDVVAGPTQVYQSSVAATVWTLVSSSPSTSIAPYQFRVCPFRYGNAILNGFRASDGINVARSLDEGATWTPTNTSNIPGVGFEGMTVEGATVFAWGDGIMSSDSGLAWQTVLPNFPGSGFVNSLKGNGLVLAVGVDDAGDGGIWALGVTPAPPPPVGVSFDIVKGISSTGPIGGYPGDGSGFYYPTLNGGFGCGTIAPDPSSAGGARVMVVGWQSAFGGVFMVVLQGTLPQNYFTSVSLGPPANLTFLTAAATLDTATAPGFTIWRWASADEFTWIGATLHTVIA